MPQRLDSPLLQLAGMLHSMVESPDKLAALGMTHPGTDGWSQLCWEP